MKILPIILISIILIAPTLYAQPITKTYNVYVLIITQKYDCISNTIISNMIKQYKEVIR